MRLKTTIGYHCGVDWDRIRQRFRILREQKGLSQDAVGALVGKSGSAISQFETGATLVRIQNLERYCEAIECALILEAVPTKDAELIQRLADVLPWASPNARKLMRQIITSAELHRTVEQAVEGGEIVEPQPEPESITLEVDEEPTTTGSGSGGARGRR